MATVGSRAVKIVKRESIRPPKFGDKALNKKFGAVIAGLSDNDAQAVLFRYVEVQVALKLRHRWLAHAQDIAAAAGQNDKWFKTIAEGAGWVSIADEALEYIRSDQTQLDKEGLLARAHIALCDKVIAELVESLTSPSLAFFQAEDGIRDDSPLRHLQTSAAAADGAEKRLGAANEAWNAAMDEFSEQARVRHTYAGTDGSVTIEYLDALSADMFEEMTAWLLQRDGCEVVRKRGGPNDQGADVIALTVAGQRVVLQCKHSRRPKSRVDPRCVRELNGTARQEHGADIVGIITNRTLSDSAQSFAARHRIHVIDRRVLQRWATYGVSWLPSENSASAST